MIRPSIDTYYMQMAFLAATRASCPKRKVGCIITDHDNRVLSIGYNGPPRKLPSCLDVPCGGETEEHPCVASHSEISALMACRDIRAAKTIYITCSPCISCVQAIMSTKIERIVFAEVHKTWAKSKSIWTGKYTFMNNFDSSGGIYEA